MKVDERIRIWAVVFETGDRVWLRSRFKFIQNIGSRLIVIYHKLEDKHSFAQD
ncbi:MAG: hypothetical protein PUP90_09575 [Nostoc sp. S4]|nr:hypothetical protein [Nostoc sp. S4]